MFSCDSYSSMSIRNRTSAFTETNNSSACKPKNVVQKSEFGNYQETYNWVECESKTLPGKTYFFNLRTKNSTWSRPISKRIHLQFFKQKSSMYDNDMAPNVLENSSSSNSEKEDYAYIENKKNERNDKEIYKNSVILAQLYYGASIGQHFDNNEHTYFNSYFNYFVENLSNKDCLELHDSSFHQISEDENFNSSATISNFLEVELFTPEDTLRIKEKSKVRKENDTSITQETLYDSMTSYSGEEKKEDVVHQNYLVPRLQKIKTKNLLRKNLQNRKKAKVVKKQILSQKKKVQKTEIVCEMHGTKTINYDPVEPNLPPGVKITNLSDSSEEVSSLGEKDNVNFFVSNNSRLFNMDSNVQNLSSKSESSTCSSSSSSSSSNSSSSCSCSCSTTSISTIKSKTFSSKFCNTFTKG